MILPGFSESWCQSLPSSGAHLARLLYTDPIIKPTRGKRACPQDQGTSRLSYKGGANLRVLIIGSAGNDASILRSSYIQSYIANMEMITYALPSCPLRERKTLLRR